MVETLERAALCIPPLNASCRVMPGTPQMMLIKVVLYCIAVFTVILNLLVVISISHFRQLHTPTNFLILSLAVSDLLVGATVMPASVIALQSCGFLGNIKCALFYLTSFILTSASVGSMVLISVDRYVAICNPLLYSSLITISRVSVCLCVCWISSVSYNFVILKDLVAQMPIDVSNSCNQKCRFYMHYISGTLDLILTFVCPVAVIIILYMRVFVVAVSHARAMQSQIASGKSKVVVIKKSELKAARSLGIVLLVFVLCIVPYYSMSLAGWTEVNSLVQIWIFYCNSTFNPLIYAFSYPWFRRAVTLIVSLQILQPCSRDIKIMQS